MILEALLFLVPAIVLGGIVFAIFRALQRNWPAARRTARFAMLAGLAGIAVFAIALRVSTSDVDVEPSQRARILAQTISEGMNCAALSLLLVLVALILWFIARRQMRKKD